MSTLRTSLVMLLGCAPVPGLAQGGAVADTTPFHRGQWAAQFGAGTSFAGLGFASLGFLKFTTPTRAWVLDFRLSGGHSHDAAHRGDSLLAEGFSSDAVAGTRVGRRFYQARGSAVASFQTVGLLGGFTHACQGSSNSPASFCTNGWDAGGFAEIGGVYLVNPRLSLGGTASASFTYERSQGRDALGDRETHWAYSGAFQGLSFTATVYF